MTGQELLTEIRERLDEPEQTKDSYFNDTRMLAILNRIYREVVFDTRCLHRQTNNLIGVTYYNEMASTADSPIHYLPDDFMAIHPDYGVWWDRENTVNYKLIGKTLWDLRREGLYNGVNVSGTPRYYIVNQHDLDSHDNLTSGKVLLIYPYPSATGNKVECTYIPKPDDITLTTDPVIDVPFQKVLIYGVCEAMKAKRRQWEDVNYFNAKFTELKSKMFGYQQHKEKGDTKQVKRSFPQGASRNRLSGTVTTV